MSRWFGIVLLLFVAKSAAAKVVMRVPMVSDQCASSSSWDDLTKCLHRFGEITVLSSTKTTRVVHIAKKVADEVRDEGTYLYVATGSKWILGGMHREAGELLTFDSITIGKHQGYRLEFAQLSPTNITLEDQTTITPRNATIATTTAVYCAGNSPECTEAVIACDLLVRGRAYRTFRGVVRIQGGQLEIVGDRTQAGDCAPPETTKLQWP